MTDVTIAITTGVGADVTVFSTAAANNFGASVNHTIATSRKPLLRFDLSSIPAGATCSSAVLKLYNQSTTGINNTYGLYKITDANGNWIEGTKDNATAGAGEPCWSAKEANGSGGVTTAWAGSAGLATAGTDYIDTVLATVSTGASITLNAVLEIPFGAAGLAVLASWFGQATNNGLLMLRTSGSATGNFHSKQATTEGYRPTLTITYTEAGAFIPINLSAQMQSLTGGMRG